MTVFTDREERKQHVIEIIGYVDPIPMGVLEVRPRKVSAGEIRVDRPAQLVIPMKNTGDADMIVTRVVSKKHGTVYFDATTGGDMSLRPGETREVPIQIVAAKPGRYLDYVMIHSNARNVTARGYKVVVLGTAVQQ